MRDFHKSDFYPKLVTRDSKTSLKIVWDDDKECIYKFRELRYFCQCALCKHEITGNRLIKLENIPEDIDMVNAGTVGNYALHFTWTDGHSTGIYSYEYLRKLCTSKGNVDFSPN